MATHSLKGPQNQWWRHCDLISQSITTKSCTFVCYTKRHLCAKFEENWTRNKEVAKNGKWHHCDVISKNCSATFCVWVFFTHTYWFTNLQADWRSDTGITGGGTKHSPPPRAENDQKSPGRIGLNVIRRISDRTELIWIKTNMEEKGDKVYQGKIFILISFKEAEKWSLNPKFGSQKSALLWLKSHNFS